MSLRALLRDICTGVEIYYTGRSEDEYLKTAFVLCDDYTELTSKLWLRENVTDWSDSVDREQRRHQVALAAVIEKVKTEGTFQQDVVDWLEKEVPRDRFKNYHRVQEDIREALQNDAARLPAVEPILRRMSARREQRNGFFHSAQLLSLTIGKSECVDAFCDLLDYGCLLFGAPGTTNCAARATCKRWKFYCAWKRKLPIIQRCVTGLIAFFKVGHATKLLRHAVQWWRAIPTIFTCASV